MRTGILSFQDIEFAVEELEIRKELQLEVRDGAFSSSVDECSCHQE